MEGSNGGRTGGLYCTHSGVCCPGKICAWLGNRCKLYLKINQKEPFDILYFTPGFISILNLDDRSYSISPEMQYTGFTNWELRLRLTFLQGGNHSEFGEK